MFPLKLEKLHPCGTFKILPIQLLNRTRYLKYVEELTGIIQRLKPLLYKDLLSKLYTFAAIYSAIRRAILWLKRRGFTHHGR